MDIKEYSYILAVVECGSISKAAKELYISQPSLTTYINNLERRLGFHFFVEGKGKSELTPEGELYVGYAKQIMILNHNLYEQLNAINNIKHKLVRIGIAGTRSTILIPKLLPALKKKDPSLQVEILEGNSKQLEEALRRGELDFALLNDSVNLKGFDYESISEEKFVLLAPDFYQLSDLAEISENLPYPWIDIRHAKELPFVMLHHGHRVREIADTLFQKNDIKPHIVFETENAVTACRLVEAGYGCSFILGSYAEQLKKNVNIFLVGSPTISRKLVIARLKNREYTAAGRSVAEMIKILA